LANKEFGRLRELSGANFVHQHDHDQMISLFPW